MRTSRTMVGRGRFGRSMVAGCPWRSAVGGGVAVRTCCRHSCVRGRPRRSATFAGMSDHEDDQYAAGEFPPGLDRLSGEIDRMASQHPAYEDVRDQAERLAPFVGEARRAIAQGHGNSEAMGVRMREALSAIREQAPVMMSATGRLTVSGTVYGAATITGAGALTAQAIAIAGEAKVLVDQGVGVDSLQVERSPASRSVLDRLAAGYVYYIVVVWILTVGAGVVLEQLNLPPDVTAQLQSDTGIANLALDLTLILLKLRKR